MANPASKPSDKVHCVGCGVELTPGTAAALCPKCLLKVAMETQPRPGGEGTIILKGMEPKAFPQPGEQFGHYSIIRLLGAGGMGAVYEAQDQENGRRVALKVLSHTLDSPEARERFLREGRLAASINHPNSVYIFGTEQIGGTPVIAMELVTGGTLQERVRACGPLPIGEAVDCVRQIIEGLEAARRIGILHRDIKPSNCFVGEDGSVKIGDFGLSISTTVRTEPALTATGAFLGTPAFCSPEQLRGEELNTRSDMYSVGATLYYLLTGRTAFEAPNLVQLLATVLEQRSPSPRQFRPEIPAGLSKAVLRCLEKQPGERFKSYADLAQALAPYGSTAPTPATFGLRFLAGLIDMVLLSTVAMLGNVVLFGSPVAFLMQAMQLSPMILKWVLGWIVWSILYYGVLEGLWGAATGKALCRLRVVGPGRNPPGFIRATLRALIYVLPPFAPYWAIFGMNPKAYMSSSQWTQMLLGFSCYGVMALLFATIRRRNGFAAIHDLITRTRVVSRSAVSLRPVMAASDTPLLDVQSALTVGPYHVLQPLAESPAEKWFLAYDLKLLRKVWVRRVPQGAEPVPAALRNLGRIGRLRWLTGKRSPEENWDAFEALNGRPLLELNNSPQPWSEVRYWLHDLATEISIAEKDGTLPELALDRVWITGEGRAKLLDFPAPGAGAGGAVVSTSVPPAKQLSGSEAFLSRVASVALEGTLSPEKLSAGLARPLPLHARAFLEKLPQMPGANSVAVALKPLLSRAAAVSRLRRAALVAGCLAVPIVALGGGFFSLTFLHDLTRSNPGLLDLSSVLQDRSTGRFWSRKSAQFPTDRQFAIYIAHHYRNAITNEATWTSPFTFALIQGESRRFAEQSVANHPAPTQAEITDADSAVGKFVPKEHAFAGEPPAWVPSMIMVGALAIYVCIPAVIAALLFRGGIVLLIAGVTYVRKDGRRASRLRLLWRAMVTWTPCVLACTLSVIAISKQLNWGPWLALAVAGLLAACSVALPGRGLQDRLAGTWPVPR